jgi:hypothetical protein
MLGIPFTVQTDQVAETTVQSLIRLSAPSTAVIAVVKAWVAQDSVDNLNEVLGVQIHEASTDGTGASVTARAIGGHNGTFGGTAIGTITADPTAGNILVREGFNAAAGWVWTPFDESDALVIAPSGRLVLHLDTAPSESMNFSAGFTFYEIGT